jgi:hypothetical protein
MNEHQNVGEVKPDSFTAPVTVQTPRGELDVIYTADEFARLLKLPMRTFEDKVAGRQIIPIELGGRTSRFNLRMNLARWMHEAHIPAAVIAASFGVTLERKS